jgi:membrane protein YdbS with pleckstrin-like domain
MKHDEIVIKKSPFQFLKWLVIIEFFFALVPSLLLLLPVRSTYDATPLAGAISYNFLLVISWTLLQTVTLVAVFVAWYIPTYVVNDEKIIYRRGNTGSDRRLIWTQAISDVEIHQGWLARRFDYGTLNVLTDKASEPVKLSNIPDPELYAEQIRDLVEPEKIPVVAPEVKPLPQLIDDGENQFVEFKASLMWDYRQKRANKALYDPVMKNVVGFMNAAGGTLLIGVSDDGEILGLEPDFSVMKKQDKDGFENVFNMAFGSMIGIELPSLSGGSVF